MGLKTQLFGYQRETVAAMLQKELNHHDIPDPLFVPIVGLDSTMFYLQPAKMEILIERPQVSSTRGGILCEELGTGKTVMVLSVIVSTLHELPSPEPSIIDSHRPVLTPVAFRHFSGPDYQSARQRAHIRKTALRVPSLVEILLHRTRIHPTHVAKSQERFEETRLWSCYQRNIPFYHHYPLNLADLHRKKRNNHVPGPKTMFLTSASLVIVPTNLISQWMTEIHKHCAIPVRVLTVRRSDSIPSARVLASEYDVSRFVNWLKSMLTPLTRLFYSRMINCHKKLCAVTPLGCLLGINAIVRSTRQSSEFQSAPARQISLYHRFSRFGGNG
jgi:hypothetical protein